MMGTHDPQRELFAYHINLDKRVRSNHPLRRVAERIDFNFVREEVKDGYADEANKLDDQGPCSEGARPEKAVNKGLLNCTDPDAPVVTKPGKGFRARYKNYRALDDACGVITAVETTPGNVEENAKMVDWVEQHEPHTQTKVETVVADRQYGTIENFLHC